MNKCERKERLDVMGHTCNPSTWPVKGEGSGAKGQSGLRTELEFKVSLSYMKSYLKGKKKKQRVGGGRAGHEVKSTCYYSSI